MGVRYDDGSTRSAGGSTPLAHSSTVIEVPRVPPGAGQPHPDLRCDEDSGGRRDCLGGRALVSPNSRPYFAPMAVILIVQPTIYNSLSRAFQRVVGVVLGVAAALVVSHFLTPSGWSIGIIVFVGLLLGWSIRLGPQGVVQIPISALLVFAVGSATPGYGARRVLDTLIGSAIAVLAVLVSPSAPTPERVVSDALGPLRRCRDILVGIGSAISSAWTLEQAEAWRKEALGMVEATAKARQDHEGHQLTARWNARARRQRPVLERRGRRAGASANGLPSRLGPLQGLWWTGLQLLVLCPPSAQCSSPPLLQLRPTQHGLRRLAVQRIKSDFRTQLVPRRRRWARPWPGSNGAGETIPPNGSPSGPSSP